MEISVKDIAVPDQRQCIFLDEDATFATARQQLITDELELPENFAFLTKTGNQLTRRQEERLTLNKVCEKVSGSLTLVLKSTNRSTQPEPVKVGELEKSVAQVAVKEEYQTKKCNQSASNLTVDLYQASRCSDVKICHRTGILSYDTTSRDLPVGQFIGPKSFSVNFNSFSFEVIDTGDNGYIGAGICPSKYPTNSQPGWRKLSFGFHGDDGGIYKENGQPCTNLELTFQEGDIIKVMLDVKARMLSFNLNGEKVYSFSVSIPNGGFYPIIGLHSKGEKVRLMEKEPWSF